MASRQQETSYRTETDEWADWGAWQGYEFWSAQLEAEMEFLSELQQAMSAAPLPAAQEGQGDVLPF
ncbi:MAG TPA: hypothetical protein VJZ91_04240 [Blastocatellia bacterium]|nr:hypothetical protein [Blastocatellia bacterium]